MNTLQQLSAAVLVLHIVLLFLSSTVYAAAPTMCFNCSRLSDADSCKNFNPCNAGETCFHEVLETDSGDAVYSWGCASQQLCLLEQGLTARKKRLNIQRCFECCSDSFCNFGACQRDYCAKVSCQNHATCVNKALGHVCDCQPGYTGKLCEIDIDECSSSPCQNNGTCIDQVAQYTCTCPAGYTGDNCEIDIDECASSPCQNGASCVDGVSQYSCTCVPGYTGYNCETDIDECSTMPCQHNGTCVDLVNAYRCDCIPGITGRDCEIDIDECANVTCQNGGSCSDFINRFQCSCAYGFEGTFCEISLGRVCYSCDRSSNVTDCTKEVICGKDEECYLEHELDAPGDFKFSLGCVPTQMCTYLQSSNGRRAGNSIQLCYECCDINGCNHHACADSRGR